VPKRIALLGSTGSIGQNCLQIVDQFPSEFCISALACHSNSAMLTEQLLKYKPDFAALTNADLTPSLKNLTTTLLAGESALEEVARISDYDLLVNAVVGAAGFLPTLAALERGKDVAIANKESLVIGGEIVMKLAKEHKRSIIPIDSEHSAIFQCLFGEKMESVEKIILTASGGPFRQVSIKDLVNVTVEQALNHPNWNMGKKITIDSATMMNKGLEVIEAHWLFDMPIESIQVLIHPQSIIHSMVEFYDGSVKAQLGLPDMRIPIQLALTYPDRKISTFSRLDWGTISALHFEEPDFKKFKGLELAIAAGISKGTAPAVMNAANETAVDLFLKNQISFTDIADSIEMALNLHSNIQSPTVDQILDADRWARATVMNAVC